MSWNSLIFGYDQQGRMRIMLEVLGEMCFNGGGGFVVIRLEPRQQRTYGCGGSRCPGPEQRREPTKKQKKRTAREERDPSTVLDVHTR
jgi:hypothetical protein